MAILNLKATGSDNKVCMVTVRNSDGSLNRRFRITKAQYEALAVSGRPPGVNAGESWYAVGQFLDVGDCAVRTDGTLLIKLDETITASDVQEIGLEVPAGQWSGTPPNITIPAKYWQDNDVNRGHSGQTRAQRIAVVAVTAGAVDWAKI